MSTKSRSKFVPVKTRKVPLHLMPTLTFRAIQLKPTSSNCWAYKNRHFDVGVTPWFRHPGFWKVALTINTTYHSYVEYCASSHPTAINAAIRRCLVRAQRELKFLQSVNRILGAKPETKSKRTKRA